MREIKFRAWAKNLKQMFYSNSVTINLDGHIVATFGIYDKQLELMQYTGLKDKNGKEIYEGDIVTLFDNRSKWGEEECLTTSVKWSESGLNWNVYPYHNPNQYWLVIGNIMENPELLEKAEPKL